MVAPRPAAHEPLLPSWPRQLCAAAAPGRHGALTCTCCRHAGFSFFIHPPKHLHGAACIRVNAQRPPTNNCNGKSLQKTPLPRTLYSLPNAHVRTRGAVLGWDGGEKGTSQNVAACCWAAFRNPARAEDRRATRRSPLATSPRQSPCLPCTTPAPATRHARPLLPPAAHASDRRPHTPHRPASSRPRRRARAAARGAPAAARSRRGRLELGAAGAVAPRARRGRAQRLAADVLRARGARRRQVWPRGAPPTLPWPPR